MSVEKCNAPDPGATKLPLTKDPMDFTLVDETPNGHRYPTAAEVSRIYEIFPECGSFSIEQGLMLFKCRQPPPNVPLTVAGLPSIFMPNEDNYELIPGYPGHPKVPDPMTSSPFDPMNETAFDFLFRVNETFENLGYHPKSSSIYFDTLVIELKEEADLASLPGYCGGFTPYYCAGSAAWKDKQAYNTRLLQPNYEHPDYSDYRKEGLTPGVHVSGIKYAGTAGVLLKNRNTGERRLTVSNRVFADTDKVFHPKTGDEYQIGTITKRIPHFDIALVRLNEDIKFSNSSYFEAPPPTHMGTQHWMPQSNKQRPWFLFDSPYTGLVPLLYAGWKSDVIDEVPHHHFRFTKEYILKSMSMNVSSLKQGVCGSPIVIDDFLASEEDQGLVLGFFVCSDNDENVQNCFVPVLDELIAGEWEVDLQEA